MPLLADKIIDHLEAEKSAITSGAFGALESLGQRKEQLLLQLQSGSIRADKLDQIKRGAARNMRLLDAALRGLKVATDRIVALRAVQRGFDTYGADGQRQVHDSSRPAFEHKA